MSENKISMNVVLDFFQNDTSAAARCLEKMPENEAAEVLALLPPQIAASTIRLLQISYTASLLDNADPDRLNQIIAVLDPPFAAAILMHLPTETRERISGLISEKTKDQLREFLTYPEESVGRIMTTDFMVFNKNLTAEQVIEKIRYLAKKKAPASYAYVVENDNKLIGVLNMRDLMLASPEKPLESIMRKDVFTIHCFVDKNDAANELAKRKFFSAPVVDSENRILGIIKAERMIQGIQEETSRDILKMVGVGSDERTFSSLWFSMRKRLPWLHVNLATAFLAAAVVALFEGIIAKVTVLAVFLPVVAGQGGNAGAQSLAVVMRGIVMREIPPDKVKGLILKEGKLGAINGIIIGAVTAVVAWLWNSNPYLGVVIGLGMVVNLFFAGLAGASIPILMKKLGWDPAQCSSIILTTVTDVIGFFAFLGFAVIFQGFLV